jgi:hypothetical protein
VGWHSFIPEVVNKLKIGKSEISNLKILIMIYPMVVLVFNDKFIDPSLRANDIKLL